MTIELVSLLAVKRILGRPKNKLWLVAARFVGWLRFALESWNRCILPSVP